LTKTLEKNRTTFINFSSLDQFELALFQANLLLQHEEFTIISGQAAYSLRDRLMKENVVWIHDVLGHHEKKIALWGHNTHIGRNMFEKNEFWNNGIYT
jgi:erythromycin esterase-like protein